MYHVILSETIRHPDVTRKNSPTGIRSDIKSEWTMLLKL